MALVVEPTAKPQTPSSVRAVAPLRDFADARKVLVT
jgi:hypothetical protein